MLRNYTRVALRHLQRRKGYAALNIAGLAVGMACCLLILLFVRDELSYDRFHANADQIYRIVSDWGDFSVPATSWPLIEALRTDYPDLPIAQLLPFEGLVQRENRSFREEHLFFANPGVFEVFTFPLLRGGSEAALARPFTVVLTEAAAQKYFPGEDPLGQTLNFDGQFELEVTGVAQDVPANAHFRFDFLVSFATLDAVFDYSENASWGNNSVYTYLLLPGAAAQTLEAQFPDLIARHAGDDWNGAALSLQPLTRIHLYSHHNMELAANGSIVYVWVFAAIALFILLIACINFTNLATARSLERAKEVGVRKAVGARRGQLVGQFLVESVVLAGAALLLAVVLAALALPLLRALSGKPLPLEALRDGSTMGLFLGVALVAGLLAGGYPALVLSRFAPVAALRNALRGGPQGGGLRKGLVVFQFAVSIALIAGTAVVYSQLHHLRTAGLGFAQDQVLVLPAQVNPAQRAQLNAQYPAFKDALLQQPGVEHVTISSEALPSELLSGDSFRFQSAPADSAVSLRRVAVGHDFFETLGVEMAAGRSFSQDFPTDSSAYIVNEAALRLLAEGLPAPLGSPQEAIGRRLEDEDGGWAGPLVGVARDFNMATLHEEIEPMVFYFLPSWYDTYLLRVRPENVTATLASVRAVWERFNPDRPFAFSFADQAFAAQYRAEERLAQVFLVFAAFAVFIACLGLFGLAAFMAEQRTKEIGVRKVLGASVPSIAVLLSKDFAKLVLVAFVVAAPMAYVVMERWLEGFAYRIEPGPWLFLGAGALAFVIALLTVSYQAFKAAMADPVQSLRYE